MILLYFLFFLEVSAYPLLRNSSAFIIPISNYRRRSGVIQSTNPNHGLFNAVFAKNELHRLLFKYRDADKILQGLIPHDIPVQNVTSPVEYTPHDFFTPAVYSEAPLSPPTLIISGTAKMPLHDFIWDSLDVLYYGSLHFGTPPQELTVDVDTGSADLWIPSDCPSCPNKQFNKHSSSTYSDTGKKFSIAYGTGDVSAGLATDIVALQGLSVSQQAFGTVSVESDDFSGFPNSGILGVAFSSISRSGQKTLVENLIDNQQLAAPMFSVHLTRGRESGSEVCFGCMDKNKTTGDIRWLPLLSKTYWAIVLDGIFVNSMMTAANSVTAAIDTGSTFIYVPGDLAAKFYAMIPGSRLATEYGDGFYAYPCNESIDASLLFGNQEFAIDSADFNIGQIEKYSPECVGGVVALDRNFPSNFAIIGDLFIKSWYSTFDHSNGGRIGFSPSINNEDSVSTVVNY